MGIIKAALNAVGGALADSWLEVIEPAPMVLNHFATSFTVPNPERPAYPAIKSMRYANAMKIPPATTKGSICDTPFIRCL